MEIHQLRYFVAAAEYGNVSRAAEHCYVAQPSLSQQLQKLEGRLGVKLFDRIGRGIAITDVPGDHPAAGKAQLGTNDLRGQPTSSLSAMHCLGRQIEGFCSARHLSRQVVCETPR